MNKWLLSWIVLWLTLLSIFCLAFNNEYKNHQKYVKEFAAEKKTPIAELPDYITKFDRSPFEYVFAFIMSIVLSCGAVYAVFYVNGIAKEKASPDNLLPIKIIKTVLNHSGPDLTPTAKPEVLAAVKEADPHKSDPVRESFDSQPSPEKKLAPPASTAEEKPSISEPKPASKEPEFSKAEIEAEIARLDVESGNE